MRSKKISSIVFAVSAVGINPPIASGDFEKMLQKFRNFSSVFKEENSHFTEVTSKKVEWLRDDVILEADLTNTRSEVYFLTPSRSKISQTWSRTGACLMRGFGR